MDFFFAWPVSTVIVISKNPCRTPSSNSRTMCSQTALSSLPAGSAVSRWIMCRSRIVEQRLHIFYRRGICERRDAASFAIERHYIIAARWAVLEEKHLTAPFIAQIEQLVADTPQKAREVKIARPECASTKHALFPCAA